MIAELIWRTGRARRDLARMLGITPATLERYAREDRAPAATVAFLEVLAGRFPWPGCEGLRYVRGAIYHGPSPDGLPVDEIPAYRMRLKQIDALEREVRRYRTAPAQFYFDLES